MSSVFDMFVASVKVLKNRPKLLKVCLREALEWKKTGVLKAEEYDRLVEMAK